MRAELHATGGRANKCQMDHHIEGSHYACLTTDTYKLLGYVELNNGPYVMRKMCYHGLTFMYMVQATPVSPMLAHSYHLLIIG